MSTPSTSHRILLGITGSIAAYKAAEIARLLITRGHPVRACMTDSAQKFIGVATFQALTGQPVLTSFWDEAEDIGHIQWADWANLILVAPASADFIAKLAAGMADSPLLAICLATKAPIALAPAMNVNMFQHAQTQENLAKLSSRGVHIIEPGDGFLACGWTGKGRMQDPVIIVDAALRLCSQPTTPSTLPTQSLAGRSVVISAGPTVEPIDPVRFISNRSSGKMGVALATEAARRGAHVRLVHGPLAVPVPASVSAIPVSSAEQMHQAMLREVFGARPADIAIMSAAVADYRVHTPSLSKLKRSADTRTIDLVPNPDILASLAKARPSGSLAPLLVGFNVETSDEHQLLSESRRKLTCKGCDLIVANLASDAFDADTNRVWLVQPNQPDLALPTAPKSVIAGQILDRIASMLKSQAHAKA